MRDTVLKIGYTDASYGFDGRTCAVLTSIDRQSPDIAMGVDREGAGDQGMMFGYATNETRGADAAADHAGPSDHRAAGGGAEGPEWPTGNRVAAARWEEPGVGGVRRRAPAGESAPSWSPRSMPSG